MAGWIALPALILVAITALILLLASEWRTSIWTLAAQYVGVFLLTGLNWPFEMAITKLVSGGMACTVLGIALYSIPAQTQLEAGSFSVPHSGPPGKPQPSTGRPVLSGTVFRLIAAVLVGLTTLSLAESVPAQVPQMDLPTARAGMLLVGLGLLQMGFTTQTLRTILGLLTALSGYEILYSAVESSTLVAGLLSGVTLGMAMAGAYLLIAPHMDETE